MYRVKAIGLTAAGALLIGALAAAIPGGKAFSSPDAAAQALVKAARAHDVNGLILILGPSSKDLLSTGDPVADRKVHTEFVERAGQKMSVVPTPGLPAERTLLVGNDDWPLPIPIVERSGKWYFDVDRGRQEIVNRRIGSNEIDAIEVCRGYVEAQNQYGEKNRTDHGTPYYAQKIFSSPGRRDGLYWESGTDGDESPISGFIARALAQGYRKGQPFHGYYFRVLTAQGANAPGGRKSYIEDGNMTKGYALVAWPARYGATGIMTFLVDKTGIVYQKDLGRGTEATVARYTEYDPDSTWMPVKEPSQPYSSSRAQPRQN
jgi:DUF2950 family protein